jgi:alkanesulfonate monooxygenase SsuD/methylene tetrahydromethanopterin reductase-like flavin-dependent oxidoreductase (luciferase family)
MKAIWTEDEASFHGEFVNFDPIWSWPKPFQAPYPPILLGSVAKSAIKRVVDYCDGWIPIGVRAGDLKASLEELHRVAREKGRDPRTIEVSLYGTPADPDALRQLRDLGIARRLLAAARGTERCCRSSTATPAWRSLAA